MPPAGCVIATPSMTIAPRAKTNSNEKNGRHISSHLREPAPKFKNQSSMVTVNTTDGHEEATFAIHKAFACHYSPYMKAAFVGNFVEGQTQTLKLEDVRGDVFQLFAEWLYTQKLEINNKDVGYLRPSPIVAIELWVLADRMLVPDLQNLVIDGLYDTRPHWQDTRYIYEHTQQDSPLRRWAVETYARTLLPLGVIDCASDNAGHAEFLTDLLNHRGERMQKCACRSPLTAKDFYVQQISTNPRNSE